MFREKLKSVKELFGKTSVLSVGILIGIVYGSIIATITTFTVLTITKDLGQ